ncbi:hypothetical protein BM536_002010 [Streptomyces phaeoluteigriseus]|uniref:Uncharacterized protein n=1 Tax=Streptomyces phaeoluteigriseus TaxID=114686 RepID=A0A1V6MYZ9_9ACTN|nr:hypothetical protein [Streptomyces phaeoluteigriseus]OQD57547.1 hypothetical protein BM536_002010 [Streptomyces phaeoluteigriseus]
MRFTGLSDDLDRPAVDAFLSAVDTTMNSNTLLLKVSTDVPITAGNRQQVLHAYLRSSLFEEMMLAADRDRDWCNLSDFDGHHNERPLLRDGFLAATSSLSYAGFRARLRWMLCEAFSPYMTHYTDADAERLAHDFTQELFSQDGSTWMVASVEPDFLRPSGYFNGEEPVRPVYFDGSDSDTATFIHRDRTCYLLLTNGSP